MTAKTTHQLARDLLALPDVPVYVLGPDNYTFDPVAVLKDCHPEDVHQWPPHVTIEPNPFDRETFLDLTTMRDSSPVGT